LGLIIVLLVDTPSIVDVIVAFSPPGDDETPIL